MGKRCWGSSSRKRTTRRRLLERIGLKLALSSERGACACCCSSQIIIRIVSQSPHGGSPKACTTTTPTHTSRPKVAVLCSVVVLAAAFLWLTPLSRFVVFPL